MFVVWTIGNFWDLRVFTNGLLPGRRWWQSLRRGVYSGQFLRLWVSIRLLSSHSTSLCWLSLMFWLLSFSYFLRCMKWIKCCRWQVWDMSTRPVNSLGTLGRKTDLTRQGQSHWPFRKGIMKTRAECSCPCCFGGQAEDDAHVIYYLLTLCTSFLSVAYTAARSCFSCRCRLTLCDLLFYNSLV